MAKGKSMKKNASKRRMAKGVRRTKRRIVKGGRRRKMQKGGTICNFNDFVQQKFDDPNYTEYPKYRPGPKKPALSKFKNADNGWADMSAEAAYNDLFAEYEKQEGKKEDCHEEAIISTVLKPLDSRGNPLK